MKLGTDSERREFAILAQSGMSWRSFARLTAARDHVELINEQLAAAGSAQRWAVVSSSDPARETTATCENRKDQG